MSICFHGEVILANRTLPGGYVVCDEGSIVAIGLEPPAGIAIVEGRYIAPGFVDLHLHGGDGSDYMDGTVEAVRVVNRAHARHGTTTLFPTTTTGSPAEIEAMLDACTSLRDRWSSRWCAHRWSPLLRALFR